MSSLPCTWFRSSALAALVVVASCASPPPPPPDAAPASTVPTSPAGSFAVTSWLDLRVPAPAGPVLAMLIAATDGPDDPARYLVDRMIATMPDGPVKSLASRAAPYVAAYLNERLSEIAPRFVTGIDAMASGLSRIATRVGTVETLQIDASGAARRTITGVRFEVGAAPVTVSFAEGGLASIAVGLHVALDATGRVALSAHAHRWPYGALLTLGLGRAVAPSVEPTARDLASALARLVDCERLGALVAERVGLGPATLYASACRAGMTAIASEVEAQLASIDEAEFGLDVTGAATGVDLDGDGSMDELRTGQWSGSLSSRASREPIAAGSFTGTEAPMTP